MKKNLQNIDQDLEEFHIIRNLLQKLIGNNGHNINLQEILNDLSNSLEHYKQAYLEFNLVTQASLDVILRLSATGKISYISPSCAELSGYEPYEITGRSFTEFIPQSRVYEYTNLILNLFRGREEIAFLMDILHKDGSIIPVEINGRVIESGGKFFAQATMRDISKRIESQRKLESSENTFHKSTILPIIWLIQLFSSGNTSINSFNLETSKLL